MALREPSHVAGLHILDGSAINDAGRQNFFDDELFEAIGSVIVNLVVVGAHGVSRCGRVNHERMPSRVSVVAAGGLHRSFDDDAECHCSLSWG
jgi:hypothetical protein